MRDVAIFGVGMTPVGEHWDKDLRTLATNAITAALDDGGINAVDALYVANAFGPTFSSQSHVATLVADDAGLRGVEAVGVEAADASGGAALRMGFLAVASGLVETALVVGVEKASDTIGNARNTARAVGLDADYESVHGVTLTAQAALLMRRYMVDYGVSLAHFEGFSINAHANGKLNANAMFRNALKPGAFAKASMVADPVNLFDGAPDADGAAALLLTSAERANAMTNSAVRIAGSGASTDSLTLHSRTNPLDLNAVRISTRKAFEQAGISDGDIDFAELHDAYTILTVLSLEAMGVAEAGKGWQYANDNGSGIGLNGKLPISTFGGLKSRGNPVGATGIYQAVEAVLQLRGSAGDNQVPDAHVGLIQSVGGLGSTVFTHILTSM
jgi:acetyl-CoA C-acetyltransferase